MSTTREFTVITGTRDHEFVVHAKGCRDVARTLAKNAPFADTYEIWGETVDEAVTIDSEEYQAQDQGWETSDYHVMACCH